MTRGRYPAIEPYEFGMLDVGDRNQIYWEVCGNPAGRPAVVLHGGPGSGCATDLRRYFSPDAYRIILFDQRGCGRSTPNAARPDTDLSVNTTEHLVADLEKLREHLGVERWVLFGGSWGSALGLVYAERFPERVTAMVFTGVATGRRAETDLLTGGLAPVFPAAWERFAGGVPDARRGRGLVDAYHELLTDPDPAVREKAARDWCDWEAAIVPTAPGPDRFADPDYRLCFAKLVTHYWRNGSWLAEGAVLADAGALAGIPGVLVQGVLDLGNLLGTPWELANAWPAAELVMIGDAGHDTRSEEMVETLVGATDDVWFWAVLESSSPSVGALADWLAEQSPATVEHFAHAYADAARKLADYCEGIEVDGAGSGWPEDDMRDLCNWIVSQGKAFWTAVRSGRYSLVDAAHRYLGRPGPIDVDTVTWDTAVSVPGGIGRSRPEDVAGGVHRKRFGEILDQSSADQRAG